MHQLSHGKPGVRAALKPPPGVIDDCFGVDDSRNLETGSKHALMPISVGDVEDVGGRWPVKRVPKAVAVLVEYVHILI